MQQCAVRFNLVCFVCTLTGCTAASDLTEPTREVAASSSALHWRGAECKPLSERYETALRSAAERLANLQADRLGDNAGNGLDDEDPDDGGWDWTVPSDALAHTAETSPANTYGNTALGPWSLLQVGIDTPRLRTMLLDASLGLQLRAATTTGPNELFLALFGQTTDNPGYATLAEARYQAQLAPAGDAQTLGEQVRDRRYESGLHGLVPYDLAWLSLAASGLEALFPEFNYAADAVSYAKLVQEDLTSETPRFDPANASEPYYTHGLAWSLVALSQLHAHEQAAGLYQQLLATQRDDGAWPRSEDEPDANLQATAHAATALALTASDHLHARLAIRQAAAWLLKHQTEDGGWDTSEAVENPQVNGETILALRLAACLPADDEDPLEPTAAPSGTERSPAATGN